MNRLTEKKIIIVVRRSRLDELICLHNTLEQARFVVSREGTDFGDIEQEDRVYKQAIARAEQILSSLGRVQVLYRDFLPNFIFGDDDTVVVIGQDGLVANVLKYLNNQPIVGVNPDPDRNDGVLLPFSIKTLAEVIRALFAGKTQIQKVSMGQVTLSDGQVLYAVNDFFIGAKSHVSARYKISFGGKVEVQSSSGIIVSTGLGSTGWLKSILTGAAGIYRILSRGVDNLDPINQMPPDALHLYFAVREPFPSSASSASLVFGKIDQHQQLTISSGMSKNGTIFSDGVEDDYLSFNCGVEAKVELAQKVGRLVKG